MRKICKIENSLNGSVVVLTYNGRLWINPCLRSIIKAGINEDKLFVIDNASTDGTTDIIRLDFPNIRLIVNSYNLGFGSGNNIGIQAALELGSEFIMLLNQDTRIAPDCIIHLHQAVEDRGKEGLFVPLQLTYDGARIDPSMRKGLLSEVGSFVDDLWRGGLQPTYELPAAYGGALLFHRSIFERVGLFDECFFLYGEDEDLCRRIKRAGIPIWLVPQAHVYHWHTIMQGKGEKNPSINHLVRRSRIILELKDIERTWSRSYMSVMHTLFNQSLHAIALLEWQRFRNSVDDIAWLFRNIQRIKRSREHDKMMIKRV